jgi:hypothetical protein
MDTFNVFLWCGAEGQYCDVAKVIVIVHLVSIFLHAQNSKIKNSPVEIQIFK